MVKKLAIRSLGRGIGSMDYINSLLIMEDDLDEDETDNIGVFGEPMSECDNAEPSQCTTRQTYAPRGRKQMLWIEKVYHLNITVC